MSKAEFEAKVDMLSNMLALLKQEALFSCRFGDCAAETSYHHYDLRIWPTEADLGPSDGVLPIICEQCWEHEKHRLKPQGLSDEEEDAWDEEWSWHNLEEFHPFGDIATVVGVLLKMLQQDPHPKREHIRQQMRDRMEIEYLEDGFAYYSPKLGFGVLSPEQLREVALYLDELNAAWIEGIDKAGDESTDPPPA